MTGDPLSLPRVLLPSLGFGALFTFIHLEMWWWALVSAVLTIGVAWLTVPRSAWDVGLDLKTTSDTDFTRWDHLRIFLPGPTLGLGPQWWPLYFAGVTGVTVWTFRASARRTAAMGRRRIAGALEQTSLEDATGSRLRVADDHHDILRALLQLGAVDGIRARMWRLADAVGREVSDVREAVLALDRVGVVRVSTIDAGADTTRHLVDLSPVGVRVMEELRRR